MHVPKTAGSTLKLVIQRQYPAERTLIVEGEELLAQYKAFQAQPPDVRRRLRCVIGHVPYGVHAFLPHGARYITMLRDPVEWTLSFHAFIRPMQFLDDHPDFAAFRGLRKLDLDGFVDFLVSSNMINMQTRAISGQIDVLNVFPPYSRMSEDALERATHNLHANFLCVGVVERFDESLLIMKRKLGWGRVYYRRLNMSEGRAGRNALPPRTVQRILECHRYDAELYREAARILAGEIEKAGPSFAVELRRFQRINTIYGRILPFYEASGLHRIRQAVRRALQSPR